MAHNAPIHTNNLAAPPSFPPTLRQRNNRSPNLATGSATQTLANTPQRSESPEPLVLRLRGAHSPVAAIADESLAEGTEGQQHRRRRTRIQWAEGVIDNEGLGRKKSKVCCIYHKPRAVGESSDESSSDSSSSDSGKDSDGGYGRDGAVPAGGAKRGRGRGKKHMHNHGDDCNHDHDSQRQAKQARRPSPNAYEKMPKYDIKPLTQHPGSGN